MGLFQNLKNHNTQQYMKNKTVQSIKYKYHYCEYKRLVSLSHENNPSGPSLFYNLIFQP